MLGARLDRQVVIQTFSEERDAAGQPVKTWSTFATVWAEKRDMRGSERFDAQQIVDDEVATFVIRWLAGVTAEMRVVADGRTYEIVGAPAEIGRREGLEITGKAIVA